jgi:LytS/YehU family sensor histidine kinase
MQINKWRLFGLHYAFVFTVLFFWGFLSSLNYVTLRDNKPIPWVPIIKTLFLHKDSPAVIAIWSVLFGTSFYLFIFQDLIQKKYRHFISKFLLFIGLLFLIRTNIESITIYILYTAFFTLIMYVWQSRKREAELEKLQRETEIQSLKAQLNPHFLFNSLNTIYSSALTEKDTSTAQLVQQLSGILRHSVEEVQQEKTDIQKEMAFIEKYVALQHARLPEHPNVSIQTQFYWDEEPAQIAPLLLIPFVENAFQYGISIDEPSFVKVDLRVEDRKLHLKVENSITHNQEEKKGAGTGLKNAEKRLQLLYSDRYSLRCEPQKDTFEIDLNIQL